MTNFRKQTKSTKLFFWSSLLKHAILSQKYPSARSVQYPRCCVNKGSQINFYCITTIIPSLIPQQEHSQQPLTQVNDIFSFILLPVLYCFCNCHTEARCSQPSKLWSPLGLHALWFSVSTDCMPKHSITYPVTHSFPSSLPLLSHSPGARHTRTRQGITLVPRGQKFLCRAFFCVSAVCLLSSLCRSVCACIGMCVCACVCV